MTNLLTKASWPVFWLLVAGDAKLHFSAGRSRNLLSWLRPLHDLWLYKNKMGDIFSMNSDLPGVTRKFADYKIWLKRLGETCFSLSLASFAFRLNSALRSLSLFLYLSPIMLLDQSQHSGRGLISGSDRALWKEKELLSRSRSCARLWSSRRDGPWAVSIQSVGLTHRKHWASSSLRYDTDWGRRKVTALWKVDNGRALRRVMLPVDCFNFLACGSFDYFHRVRCRRSPSHFEGKL